MTNPTVSQLFNFSRGLDKPYSQLFNFSRTQEPLGFVTGKLKVSYNLLLLLHGNQGASRDAHAVKCMTY